MLRLAAILAAFAVPAAADGVASARYDEPTTRYAHGVLGDAVEWGALVLETDSGRNVRIRLPDTRVFEDTEPRVIDIEITCGLGGRVVETTEGGAITLGAFRSEDWVNYSGHPAVNNHSDVRWTLRVAPGESVSPEVRYHYFTRR